METIDKKEIPMGLTWLGRNVRELSPDEVEVMAKFLFDRIAHLEKREREHMDWAMNLLMH